MRFPALRHRLAILAPTDVRDAHGGNVRTYTTRAVRYAAIEPLKGEERFEAGQVEPRATVRITIRYYSGLSEGWRLGLLSAGSASGSGSGSSSGIGSGSSSGSGSGSASGSGTYHLQDLYEIVGIIDVDEVHHLMVLMCTEVRQR